MRRVEGTLAALVSGPLGRVAAMVIEMATALTGAARARLRASRSA